MIGNVAVFSIGLQCTGLLSTDVDIRIQLNVSRALNVIILDIRRKKACLRGTRSVVFSGVNASSRLGGRTTECGGVWEGTEANWWRLIAE